MHRPAVPLDKQTICFDPLVTETYSLLILFSLQLLKHIHYILRKLLASLRLLCFCGISIDPFIGSIIGSPSHTYYIVIEINILPFETEKLSSAVSAVNCKLEEYSEL